MILIQYKCDGECSIFMVCSDARYTVEEPLIDPEIWPAICLSLHYTVSRLPLNRFSAKLIPNTCTAFRFTYSGPRICHFIPRITYSTRAWLCFACSASHLACSTLAWLTLVSLFSGVLDISDVRWDSGDEVPASCSTSMSLQLLLQPTEAVSPNRKTCLFSQESWDADHKNRYINRCRDRYIRDY